MEHSSFLNHFSWLQGRQPTTFKYHSMPRFGSKSSAYASYTFSKVSYPVPGLAMPSTPDSELMDLSSESQTHGSICLLIISTWQSTRPLNVPRPKLDLLVLQNIMNLILCYLPFWFLPPRSKSPLSLAHGKGVLTEFPDSTLVPQQSSLQIIQIIFSKYLATMSLPSVKSSLQLSNALRIRNSNPLVALSVPKHVAPALPR